MKIVDRATFLTLPPGTVFSKTNSPGSIGILVQSYWPEQSEFVAHECYPHSTWTEEDGDTFEVSVEGPCRDGWYEFDIGFLIWPNDEVAKLRDLLTEALKMTGGEAP